MKRIIFIILFFLCLGVDSIAQKVGGFGGELSVLGAKINYRDWVSKKTGFEFFGGVAAELDDVKPNDFEAGFKFLHALIYSRTDRTYFGIIGKYKWVNLPDENARTSLPVPGFIIGKEWYSKRVHRKGFAVELGYQFGTKEYQILAPENHSFIGKDTFNEFPLILNIRYSFYSKR
jgi:hypothetical protein